MIGYPDTGGMEWVDRQIVEKPTGEKPVPSQIRREGTKSGKADTKN
jgi:hypothetical protein